MTPWAWALWLLVLSFCNAVAYRSPSTAALEEKEGACSPCLPAWRLHSPMAGDRSCEAMAVPPACVSDGVWRLSVTQRRLLSQSLRLVG